MNSIMKAYIIFAKILFIFENIPDIWGLPANYIAGFLKELNLQKKNDEIAWFFACWYKS